MQIQELSEKMQRFVYAKGWYEVNSPRPQSMRNIAISLCLEASEVLEHFQWSETTPSREKLADELADVMLYLLQLARLAEIDLEKAVLNKLSNNYQRTWE